MKRHSDFEQVTLIFTDLKGSTALYEALGDEAAFALVQEHFEILAGCVCENGGEIVKTLGDAIMAVFRNPRNAIVAAFQMREELADRNSALKLRISVHGGRCLRVRDGEQVDFFGGCVNAAARMVELCAPGEVIFSTEVLEESGVRALIEEAGYSIRTIIGKLKGLRGDYELLQISIPRRIPADAQFPNQDACLRGHGDCSNGNKVKSIRGDRGIKAVMGSSGKFRFAIAIASLVAFCGCLSKTQQLDLGPTLASMSGNGESYGGGTYRGPGNASVTLGLTQVGSAGTNIDPGGIATDTQGYVYVGMATTGSAGAIGYAAKFAPNGVQLWSVPLGEGVHVVRTDASGRVLVGGVALPGTIPGAIQIGSDVACGFVANLDPSDGAILWASTICYVRVDDVTVDSVGNVIVAGVDAGTTLLAGSKAFGTLGSQNAMVAEFTPAGALKWISRLGAGPGQTIISGRAAVSASGGIIFVSGNTGQAQGAGYTFTQIGPHASEDLLVCSFAADGTPQWVTQVGGSNPGSTALSSASSVWADASGDLIIGGSAQGTVSGAVELGTMDPTRYGLMYARFSASGVPKWIRQVGQIGHYFFGEDILPDSAGNYYLAGSGNYILLPGANYYGSESGNPTYAIDLSFDANGAIRWITQVGQAGANTDGEFLAPVPGGGVYMAGNTNGNLAGSPSGTPGVFDLLLFELDPFGNLQK